MSSSPPPRSSSDNSVNCDLSNQTCSNIDVTTEPPCPDQPLDFSIKKCTKDTSDDNESNGSVSHPDNNGNDIFQSALLEHSLRNKLKMPLPLKKFKFYGSYQAQQASKETVSPKNCDLENVGPNTTYPIQKPLIPTEGFSPKVPSGAQTVPAFQVMPEYRGNSHQYICSPPLPTQFDSPAGPSNAFLSSTSMLPINYNFAESKKKHARPFKAYQFEPNGMNYISKIPMNIGFPLDTSITQTLINTASNEAFQEFRKKALAQKKLEREKAHKTKSETVNKHNTILNESNESNESIGDESTQKTNVQPVSSTESTSRNTSRKRSKALPDELKDEVYWEKRRKNNEAAKRSRDARRIKEDEIAIKATYFEQENIQLRLEIANLRKETATLRYLLYNNS